MISVAGYSGLVTTTGSIEVIAVFMTVVCGGTKVVYSDSSVLVLVAVVTIQHGSYITTVVGSVEFKYRPECDIVVVLKGRVVIVVKYSCSRMEVAVKTIE